MASTPMRAQAKVARSECLSGRTLAVGGARSRQNQRPARQGGLVKPRGSQSEEAGTMALDLDLEEFNDVLSMVHDTDIVELSLKTSTFSINVRKKEALEQEQLQMQSQAGGVFMQQAPAAAYAPPPAAAAPPPAPAAPAAPAEPAPSAAPAAPAEAPAAPPQAGKAITSPMSGTFYRSPAPGEPAFVKEGDTVQKGQKVCIIEAMKLMNEIETEVSGKILELLVEDGAPVTPGQPLMIVS